MLTALRSNSVGARHLHVPAADDVLAAIGIHQRTGISFWDAMIVRSAAEIGSAVLFSEDLNAGQEYSGVRVENPFQPPDAGPARTGPGR